MRANLETTSALLAAARRQGEAGGPVPVVVFSSSVAVYGSDAALPLPSPVTEATLPTPQSSYGAQKYVCEQLIADYTRKGFIDGRVTRLMTVAVRPGKPNAAASGFLSGMVREPLAGIPSVVPVSPGLAVALASPRATVEGILTVAEAERGTGPGKLEGRLPVNLPALTVTVEQMLATLRRVAGDAVADLVTFGPDPGVEAIVGSWPAHFDNARAHALGLEPDRDFEAVVRQYLADRPDAVEVPLPDPPVVRTDRARVPR
jgi:nucleoside-diphosphate-sugar epimerase